MNRPVVIGDEQDRRCWDDRGSMMPMAVVFITFLLIAFASLMSASQAWGERRDSQAVAAAAARAAAQPGPSEIVGGRVELDPAAAAARAQSVLSASGHSGSVSILGLSVTVTATGTVDYAFTAPGMPSTMTATATADAANQIFGG